MRAADPRKGTQHSRTATNKAFDKDKARKAGKAVKRARRGNRR